LKRILRILMLVEHSLANAQHHRPMPFDQQLEASFLAPSDKTLQQLPVADFNRTGHEGRFSNMLDNPIGPVAMNAFLVIQAF
jgi:hypothetical protein